MSAASRRPAGPHGVPVVTRSTARLDAWKTTNSTAARDNGDDGSDDTAAESERLLAIYDLDGDGKISVVESMRATLGLIDARAQKIAEKRDGVLGKLATVAHRMLDRFDNDENPPRSGEGA